MRNLTILGATGSIGASTLKVIENNPEQFRIVALAAGQNAEKMTQLCLKWQPVYAVMADEKAADQLAQQLQSHGSKTQVMAGVDAMCEVASLESVDTVMAAIVVLLALCQRWQQ